MRLTGNAGCKKVAKNNHLGTIAQLCRAISSQLRHVYTIGKKLVKQRYVLHMFPQYGELRPTNSWDPSGSLRHPCKFQWASRLGSVTAWHLVAGVSQTAALNRGRHLCSAGWPSRWALAHILVLCIFFYFKNNCFYSLYYKLWTSGVKMGGWWRRVTD